MSSTQKFNETYVGTFKGTNINIYHSNTMDGIGSRKVTTTLMLCDSGVYTPMVVKDINVCAKYYLSLSLKFSIEDNSFIHSDVLRRLIKDTIGCLPSYRGNLEYDWDITTTAKFDSEIKTSCKHINRDIFNFLEENNWCHSTSTEAIINYALGELLVITMPELIDPSIMERAEKIKGLDFLNRLLNIIETKPYGWYKNCYFLKRENNKLEMLRKILKDNGIEDPTELPINRDVVQTDPAIS